MGVTDDEHVRRKGQARPATKVLVIGQIPPPIGGASAALKVLVDALDLRKDVITTTVSTGGVRGLGLQGALVMARIMWRITRELAKSDVVTLHVCTPSVPWIGPPVCGLCRLWRKPLIVRKFGGIDPLGTPGVRQWLSRWALRHANVYFVETKEQVSSSRAHGIEHVAWFSNSRVLQGTPAWKQRDSSQCRRFVFMSQVRPKKGIADLITAAEQFDDGVCVDVYGPFLDGLSEEIFAGLKKVRYKGVAAPDHVMALLAQYDALLLPTRAKTEGYPGILLEAYCVGLPVITTRVGAIPEIVDDACGVLLEPGDPDALYQAMRSLVEDDQYYERLRKGAWEKRLLFDAEAWTERFVEHCKNLAHVS